MSRRLAIIYTLLLYATLVFADTTSTNNVQRKQAVIAQPANKPFVTEVDMYKLLYENSKSSNDKILSTTQWTIGIVISIVLAILASQIFFNYKLNKQEVDYIKKDLDEKFTSFKLEVVSLIDENLKNHQSEINKKFLMRRSS